MKTIWVILITFVVSALAIGGGTYYFTNANAKIDKDNLQLQINDLNNKITAAEKTLADTEATATKAPATTTSETAAWKTYTNSTYGLSFKYPKDWEITENAGNNYDLSIASIVSPETKALITGSLKNGQNFGPYNDDISVYYYPTVADETENKGNSLGATTLNDLILKNKAIAKIGSVTIGGINGTDAILSGESAYYTIFAVNNNHLYKIFFSNISAKNLLTSTEKTILSTFQFSK